MESVSSLQRYQVGAQGGRAVDAQARFVEVPRPGGQATTLELRLPASPPSGFAGLIGILLGPSAQDEQYRRLELAALARFRQDLMKAYGREITDEVTRGLKDHLTVASASQAMASAQAMKQQAQANADLIATRIAATFSNDASNGGEPAGGVPAGFGSRALTAQVYRLLGRVALGADLYAPMLSREQVVKAMAQALSLFDQLRQAPGMSAERYLQILKFAASGSSNHQARQTALDLINTDPVGGQGNGRAVSDARASARLELQARLAADVATLQMQQDGPRFMAANDAFPAGLRSNLPAGEMGDALTKILSACVDPQHLVRLLHHACGPGFSDAHPLESSFTHDITLRPDGMYAIRSWHLHATASLPNGQASGHTVDRHQPVSILCRLDFLVDPGAQGETPRLASIATDVVFNSGPLAA